MYFPATYFPTNYFPGKYWSKPEASFITIRIPGIEYNVPNGRLHYCASDNRLQFNVPDQRPQYDSQGTD